VAYADPSVFAMDVSPSGDFRVLRTPVEGGTPVVLAQGNGAYMGLLATGTSRTLSSRSSPTVAMSTGAATTVASSAFR